MARNLAEEESEFLLSHVLGADVVEKDPSKPFQFALVFPIRDPDGADASSFDRQLDNKDAEMKWKLIFPEDEGLPRLWNTSNKTWEVFTGLVREKVKISLSLLGCEVEERISIDHDEYFVLFRLRSDEATRMLAEEEEARVRLLPSSYGMVEAKCPTDEKDPKLKGAWKIVELDRSLKGKTMQNTYPAYVRYRKDLADKVEDLEAVEVLRVLRQALRRYMRIQMMEKEGVVRVFYPLHTWSTLKELYQRGWNNVRYPFQWPKVANADLVMEYFGGDVASLFHFQGSLTRWLVFPGLLSLIFPILRHTHLVDEGTVTKLHCAFGITFCFWTTIFLAHLKQQMKLRLMKWGMTDSSVKLTKIVRKAFKDELRGSWQDFSLRVLHWTLAVLFMLETVIVSYLLARLVNELQEDQDKTEPKAGGINDSTLAYLVNFGSTTHILILDALFTHLSIWLSKQENHRTEMDLKSSMIVKLVAVKAVIQYYPHIHLIFVHYVTSCYFAGKHLPEFFSGQGMRDCYDDATHWPLTIQTLRKDLQIFFVSQVFKTAAIGIFQIAQMQWFLSRERKRGEQRGNSKLTYVEVQAMMPRYDETSEIADFLQSVLNFGLLAMFGAIAPTMCILLLCTSIPMQKLMGHRFSFSQQRVLPTISNGLGIWWDILNVLAYFGVTVTAYSAVFVWNAFDLPLMGQFGLKMSYFFLIERGIDFLKIAINLFFGEKTVAHERIEECNEDVERLLVEVQMRQKVPSSNLFLGCM